MDKKLQKQINIICKINIEEYYKDFTNPELNYRGKNFTWQSFRDMMMHKCHSSCWMANLGDIIPKSPEDYNHENPERDLTEEHNKYIEEVSKKYIDELFKREGIEA